MQVTGKTMIFKKEYEGKIFYSTSIRNKNINGEYTNMYLNIQLPKGIEPADKSIIEITKGFISFYSTKDGNKIPKIVALEIKQDEPKQEVQEDFYNQDSLPF